MTYKSDILEAIHKSAVEKFKIGAISKARMREFDEMCLVQKTKAASSAPEPEKEHHFDLVAV